MTARAIAARSPAGVSRAARSSTSASAARASSSSSSTVARAMISALYRETVPSSSAAAVPGRRAGRVCAIPIRLSARARDSPSAHATWSAVNSASSSPGFRRASSAIAASLRACAWASTRSHPHITPISSASETPPNRASSPAAASAATASRRSPAARPGSCPGRTPPPGWPTRRGRSARSRAAPALAARWRPPWRRAAHQRPPRDLGQLLGREGASHVLVLLLAVALVPLAQPVQGRLELRGRHRVAVQPGEILVPPGVRGNRRREHEPRPFGRRIVLSNMIRKSLMITSSFRVIRIKRLV